MTDTPEDILVHHCRAHRREAQYELYRRYQRAMFGTCLRLCGNREDAEDMLQNSFSDAFSNLHKFRADATLGAWIKRICVNNCLNHLKRRRLKLTELRTEDAEVPESNSSESNGALQTLDGEYSVEQIKQAVLCLPDGYRTVVTLYLFEGLDHAEIGEHLGISEQTSKSQYSRARAKLRTTLTPILRP